MARLHKKDELFLGVINGAQRIVIECRKENKAPFPRCHAVVKFSKEIIVKYDFSRKNLKNWRTIYMNLHKLIQSLEIKPVKTNL